MQLYLDCESGATRKRLAELAHAASGRELAVNEIDALLRDLLDQRLLIEIDAKFLSLAQPRFPEASVPPISRGFDAVETKRREETSVITRAFDG